MRISIYYPHLQKFTHDQPVVDVAGRNVGECLDRLVKKYPGVKGVLFDEHGSPFDHIGYYMNRGLLYPLDLTQPVNDEDELSIVSRISGG